MQETVSIKSKINSLIDLVGTEGYSGYNFFLENNYIFIISLRQKVFSPKYQQNIAVPMVPYPENLDTIDNLKDEEIKPKYIDFNFEGIKSKDIHKQIYVFDIRDIKSIDFIDMKGIGLISEFCIQIHFVNLKYIDIGYENADKCLKSFKELTRLFLSKQNKSKRNKKPKEFFVFNEKTVIRIANILSVCKKKDNDTVLTVSVYRNSECHSFTEIKYNTVEEADKELSDVIRVLSKS